MVNYLKELLDQGYSYRMIAELSGLSIPIIKKIVKQELSYEMLTIEQQNGVNKIMKIHDLIAQYHIDPASWLESYYDDYSFSPLQLFVDKKEDEFFKLINNSLAEEEKNKLKNDYNSQWECFMASDGYHSLRLKESTMRTQYD